MNIEQLMTKPAITCRPNHSLNTAADLMWRHDCGILPVVGDKGELLGMITDRDICMAAYTQGAPLSAILVASAMATTLISCRPGDDLSVAVKLMQQHKLRRLPVLDDQRRPLGILSLNDLARDASAAKKASTDRELVQTLAAICEPRLRAQRAA